MVVRVAAPIPCDLSHADLLAGEERCLFHSLTANLQASAHSRAVAQYGFLAVHDDRSFNQDGVVAIASMMA